MSIRVLVATEGRTEAPVARGFEQEVVTFGRSKQNVLVLEDEHKQVSNYHGRIERRGGEIFLVDLDSTNGTILNDVLVESNTPMQLRVGDVLLIGPFRIQIAEDDDDRTAQTLVSVDPARVATALRNTLAQTYAKLRYASVEQRRSQLLRVIRKEIAALPAEQARAVLNRIPSTFAPSDVSLVADRSVSNNATEELYGAGYGVMRDLARHFVNDDGFTRAADVVNFGRLLRQTLDVFAQWLARSIEGRDEFQSQFGADVTMMFQLQSSPLKGGKTAAELSALLLSWSKPDDIDSMRTALEEVCRDQGLHQLGLVSGAREAVKAVLARLDPELIRSELEARGKSWLSRGKEWDLYQATYREMTEEQNRLFEELIAPAINRGYLQAHDKHLRDRTQPNT